MSTEERIYLLRRVEAIMYEHSGVLDVAAIFVSGQDNQETLFAYVVPAEEGVAEQDLTEFLSSKLTLNPGISTPEVRLVSSIPKTASGKVHKLKLISEN